MEAPSAPPVARCPECGGPATVIDRLVLFRTTGPVLHLRTACESAVHFEHCADEDGPPTEPPRPAER